MDEEDYVRIYYESKHEDLRIAERVEKELDKIVDDFGLDIWFTVDMHSRDGEGGVKTERIIGDPERIERCGFCGRITRYKHEKIGWVCASCLGEYERGKNK